LDFFGGFSASCASGAAGGVRLFSSFDFLLFFLDSEVVVVAAVIVVVEVVVGVVVVVTEEEEDELSFDFLGLVIGCVSITLGDGERSRFFLFFFGFSTTISTTGFVSSSFFFRFLRFLFCYYVR